MDTSRHISLNMRKDSTLSRHTGHTNVNVDYRNTHTNTTRPQYDTRQLSKKTQNGPKKQSNHYPLSCLNITNTPAKQDKMDPIMYSPFSLPTLTIIYDTRRWSKRTRDGRKKHLSHCYPLQTTER